MGVHATIAAAIATFTFMDAMAWASIGKGNVTGEDFAAWVDLYMKDQDAHEYHYSGVVELTRFGGQVV